MSHGTHDWSGLLVAQGRYAVRARLGEGGMGYVYLALDRNLDCDVVIKVPRRAMLDDPEFADRFAREVRSLVRLAHPNVVRITDVGSHDGVPFAVMQYLSGGSLEDRGAGDRGPDAFPGALAALGDWLPGVASALDFVHAQGYVHRDVKPGNILFDAHGHVFLSDFGVAKALASGPETGRGRTAATGAGLVLGTPEYMAPELVMGEPFDGRIDQYALAVSVYESLGGRRPFEAPSSTAVMVLQTTRDPAPLCRVESGVPRPLSDAVARALAKDPTRRYPSCSAFAAAVLAASVAAAAPRRSDRTPSGGLPRPDPPRLHCPGCQRILAVPASWPTDPQAVRGKRVVCPSCRARLRMAEDGGSLVAAGSGSGSGTDVHTPTGTRKVASPRPETPPAVPPPARTVAAVARGRGSTHVQTAAPARPRKTVAEHTGRDRVLVAAAGLALVAGTAFAVMLLVVPSLTLPKVGRVVLDTTALPAGASFVLDGRRLDPGRVGAPIAMEPGTHVLDVSRDGFEPSRQAMPVAAGKTVVFRLRTLKALPPPPAPAVVLTNPAGPVPKPPAPPNAPTPSPPALPTRFAAPRETSSPSLATFEPVPDGPPLEVATVARLVEEPGAFAGRVVLPAGLYVIGKRGGRNPDGTVIAAVARVGFQVRGRDLAAHSMTEPPVPILVDPALARHLQTAGVLAIVAGTSGPLFDSWNDNPAVLTFHVQRRTDDGSGAWVPALRKVEFLVGMNFLKIGEGNFRRSFRTVTVTPLEPKRDAVSDRRDWSSRLGQPYVLHLKRIVHNLKDVQYARNADQFDGLMSKVIGNSLRNYVDPAWALGQKMRRTGR